MVVGKVRRSWSPSTTTSMPMNNKERKLGIRIARIEGFHVPRSQGRRIAAVEVQWQRSEKRKRLSYLGWRRTKIQREVYPETEVGDNGVAAWPESLSENELVMSWTDFGDWNSSFDCLEVSFTVLFGSITGENKEEVKKLQNVGFLKVNLEELTLSYTCSKVTEVEGCRVHRKQIPILLWNEGLASEATLHVIVTITGGQVNDAFVSNPYMDLAELLEYADKESKVATYANRNRLSTSGHTRKSNSGGSSNSDGSCSESSSRSNSDEGSISESSSRSNSGELSSELSFSSASRSRLLSWRRRRDFTIPLDKEKVWTETNPEEDSVGAWMTKELISRDNKTKMQTKIFFASIDQRDADGESACAALVAVISNALHLNKLKMKTSSELDSLIREGSSEWRKLCENSSYSSRFPNKHFDLDTVLEVEIRPITVSSENSYIGFFQPESFQSLKGAMSFDDIWNEITKDAEGINPRVYIISWNDHFFVLKVESDAYYIIDTLGERLYEGCKKAYILKFDETTYMFDISDGNKPKGSQYRRVCMGKECCREFIKMFFAAIPLKEELEMEKKQGSNNGVLHQKLQIEFHLTETKSS